MDSQTIFSSLKRQKRYVVLHTEGNNYIICSQSHILFEAVNI